MVGLSAFAIAGSGGLIGETLLPATAPALAKFEVAFGSAILSGDAAGYLDSVTKGGACG